MRIVPSFVNCHTAIQAGMIAGLLAGCSASQTTDSARNEADRSTPASTKTIRPVPDTQVVRHHPPAAYTSEAVVAPERERNQQAQSPGYWIFPRDYAVEKNAQYPEELLGTWSMEPHTGVCKLPLNTDGDGWLKISKDRIVAYEASYRPLAVRRDENHRNRWHILTEENYLGSQISKMQQTFVIENGSLQVIDIDGAPGEAWRPTYDAKYVRCFDN